MLIRDLLKLENKYFGEGNLEYIRTNDRIKDDFCKKNDIDLLRIPYWKLDDIENILEHNINILI